MHAHNSSVVTLAYIMPACMLARCMPACVSAVLSTYIWYVRPAAGVRMVLQVITLEVAIRNAQGRQIHRPQVTSQVCQHADAATRQL